LVLSFYLIYFNIATFSKSFLTFFKYRKKKNIKNYFAKNYKMNDKIIYEVEIEL